MKRNIRLKIHLLIFSDSKFLIRAVAAATWGFFFLKMLILFRVDSSLCRGYPIIESHLLSGGLEKDR